MNMNTGMSMSIPTMSTQNIVMVRDTFTITTRTEAAAATTMRCSIIMVWIS